MAKSARAVTNPIIMGRRICNGVCGRWRLITDFGHKADSNADQGRYITGACEPCMRAAGRDWYKRNSQKQIDSAKKWKLENPERVKLYKEIEKASKRTPEARAKERIRQRRRYADPVIGPKMREYHRIYRNMKRSEGKNGRPVDLRYARSADSYKPYTSPADALVPREPFATWLEEIKDAGLSFSELARTAGIDSSRYRSIVRGTYIKDGLSYNLQNVSFAFVDATILASGLDTQIWDLYPQDLYPEIYATD